MQKIQCDGAYFQPKSTLDCGQVFRYRAWRNGYLVCTSDRACYLYTEGPCTSIECEDKDAEYFYTYFDLSRDYKEICDRAKAYGIASVSAAAEYGKGMRILSQNREETVFSFLVSQNNHIPRIKSILERIAEGAGEEKYFMGEKFYTFPSALRLAREDETFFARSGAGYRAKYLAKTAKMLAQGALEGSQALTGTELRARLMRLEGVGPKVADCIALFAYRDTSAFPVDTWLEKVYREDFNGSLTDREKISEYFKNLFQDIAGYVQQYLFYCKRGEKR